MLMFFMETVGFYYRVKWIKYILLRNRKIKINCFWLITLYPKGTVCADFSAVVSASLFREFDRLTCKPDYFCAVQIKCII